MHKYVLITLLSIAPLCLANFAALAQSTPEIIRATPQQIEDWRDLRLGMFIHWGPVSLTGKEIGWSRQSKTSARGTHWKKYDQLPQRFNPVKFDANEWVNIAKEAGFKYMVFTSKHHDGFVMWDSKHTDHDIMSTPFQRDIMKELTNACKKQNLAFGPYHSICDWYHPEYGYSHQAQPGYPLNREPDPDKYYAYLTNLIEEMHTKYGPFLVFWFDGEWEKPWTHAYGVKLNHFCKKLQPDALVNNRVDKGRRGMEGMTVSDKFAGDFCTPEQRVGAFNREVPWETCMTICRQWAWKPNDKLKSLKQCLQTMIRTVGGDGNFLFNVGPMPDGRIEPRQVERLREMGQWLEKHGDKIYGTRGGPYKPGPWGASTCKENVINLFIMQWDGDTIELPSFEQKMQTIHMGGQPIQYKPNASKMTLTLPKEDQDPIVDVIQIILKEKIDATQLKPITVSPQQE